MRLAAKGRAEPIEALAQQGRVSGGNWAAHKDALAGAGFADADGPKLTELSVSLESDASKRANAAGESKQRTKSEHLAVTNAKAFRRKLTNIVGIALRKLPVAGVTEESFDAGKSLSRVTPRISTYLGNIHTHLEKADAALKPYFGGASAAALAKELKGALDAADTAQEVALANLPKDTLQVYETKGRLLELIEELNRVAKNAFEGNAATAAVFNKDILLRARKKGGGGGGGSPVV